MHKGVQQKPNLSSFQSLAPGLMGLVETVTETLVVLLYISQVFQKINLTSYLLLLSTHQNNFFQSLFNLVNDMLK